MDKEDVSQACKKSQNMHVLVMLAVSLNRFNDICADVCLAWLVVDLERNNNPYNVCTTH